MGRSSLQMNDLGWVGYKPTDSVLHTILTCQLSTVCFLASSTTIRAICFSSLLLEALVLLRWSAVLISGKNQIIGAEGINLDLAELPGADVVLEEDIEVGVGETLGFGKTEVCLLSKVRNTCIVRSEEVGLPRRDHIGSCRPRRNRSCLASSRRRGS